MNHTIKHGFFIEGKHISAWKLLWELKCRMKCQAVGANHITKDCKAEHNVCAQCGSSHCTSNCTIDNTGQFNCANCKTQGHGAANHHCPIFIKKMQNIQCWHPENKYQYYPTNNPKTWEQMIHTNPTMNDNTAT